MKLLQELLLEYPEAAEPNAPADAPGSNTPYGKALGKCAIALHLASDLDRLGTNFDNSVSRILNALGDQFKKSPQEVWQNATNQMKTMNAQGVFRSDAYQKMISDLSGIAKKHGRVEAEKHFAQLGLSANSAPPVAPKPVVPAQRTVVPTLQPARQPVARQPAQARSFWKN